MVSGQSEKMGEATCQRCRGGFTPQTLGQATAGLCGGCSDPSVWHQSSSATLRHDMGDAAHRAFTAADRALIKSMNGHLPPTQLLRILNQRLMADQGVEAEDGYTLEQLRAEIERLNAGSAPVGWSSVRKVLADARRSGVLSQINEHLINDFAVVFSLNAKQVLHLKDVLLSDEVAR